MINYPVWIPPSGQELCMVDSKGRIFKKSKPELPGETTSYFCLPTLRPSKLLHLL
uniref:Uncharacterized protein n=1 Tax=Catagonus wagneri TaxID=51154 RepID=A0A8C3X577_9CETA